MKKGILFLFLLVIVTTTQASIWRVNNVTFIDAPYRTIQAAIDDVNVLDGDTIQVEGSVYAYAGFTLNKQLVIMGPGYFLDQNPNIYAQPAMAHIAGYVYLSGLASNSTLTGLWIDYLYFTGNIDVNNVTFAKNRIGDLSGSNSTSQPNNGSNHKIIQNYLGYINTFKNCVIENNIVLDNISGVDNSSVQHNVFNADWQLGDGIGGQIESCTGSNFSNNIVGGVESGNNTLCEFTYNIFLGATASTDANQNKYVTSIRSLFLTSGTEDGKYKLSTNSAAKGAADDGGDLGVFHSNTSTPIYVLSGLSTLPGVSALSPQGVTENTLNMKVKIISRTDQ